jgi:hypothetical protein
MPDNTPSAAPHWAAAIGQRLNTGHYGPAQLTDHDSQLFVQLNSGPQARALATSVAGLGAIGERCEDGDMFRTFFLALIGAPVVITWQLPLPILIRGGRVTTTPASPRWKGGMAL